MKNLNLKQNKSTLNLLKNTKLDLLKIKSPLSLKLQRLCNSEDEENKIIFFNNLNVEKRKFNFKIFGNTEIEEKNEENYKISSNESQQLKINFDLKESELSLDNQNLKSQNEININQNKIYFNENQSDDINVVKFFSDMNSKINNINIPISFDKSNSPNNKNKMKNFEEKKNIVIIKYDGIEINQRFFEDNNNKDKYTEIIKDRLLKENFINEQ